MTEEQQKQLEELKRRVAQKDRDQLIERLYKAKALVHHAWEDLDDSPDDEFDLVMIKLSRLIEKVEDMPL